MPTNRKKPKWGYGLATPEASDAPLYSIKFVEELADRYGIAGENVPELQRLLEFTANVTHAHKVNIDEAPTPGHVAAAISEIARRAAALEEALKTLDQRSSEFFWLPERRIPTEMGRFTDEDSKPRAFRKTKGPYGHTFRIFGLGNRAVLPVYVHYEDHLESLEILQAYAKEALSRLRNDKGGRRRSSAMNIWLSNASSMWTQFTGKKFTGSRNRGTAPDFCTDAYRPLDGSITRAQMVAHIERYLRDHRTPSTRRNRVKK